MGLQLGSKDWRNRMDALRALSALGPALPEVPNAALEGLLQALVGRLSDGNAKVNQKALEVSYSWFLYVQFGACLTCRAACLMSAAALNTVGRHTTLVHGVCAGTSAQLTQAVPGG